MYYFETMHKEGGGGDNLAIGWQKPGDTEITVIVSDYLSPYTQEDEQSEGEIVGNVKAQYWYNTGGAKIADIRNLNDYPDNPDKVFMN